MGASHSTLFEKIPYNMLLSSIEHPHLTVDSEMLLSDALLRWLECNFENIETLGRGEYNCDRMLKQKVNLSDCPQITPAVLLLSVVLLSPPMDLRSKNIIELLYNSFEQPIRDKYALPQILLQTLSFEAVQEVDISKCQRLPIEAVIEWFCKSFPSLKILRAAYLLNIRTTNFLQLALKCPKLFGTEDAYSGEDMDLIRNVLAGHLLQHID